jgi:hypothetical protein
MKIVFKAKVRAGRGRTGLGGDLLVSAVARGDGQEGMSMCWRFSAQVLDKLRWRVGDRVYMELDREGTTDTWTFHRVSEASGEGLKISSNARDERMYGSGAVRRTVSGEEVGSVFSSGGERRYVGFLLHGDINKATFACDNTLA